MPQRLSLLAIAVTALWSVVHASVACAEGFTFTWHEAQGSGCANVFDGGDPRCDSVDLVGVQLQTIGFSASDSTQPGSLGALALGSGSSFIGMFADQIFMNVRLRTSYIASFLPGGDNPGGSADAELFSIIEFTMPAPEVFWDYQLEIDQSVGYFEGDTRVLIENVTQGTQILDVVDEFFWVNTTLSAQTADVIRITTTMSASGSTPPISFFRKYTADFDSIFTIIPEPATLTLLLFALPAALRRRR